MSTTWNGPIGNTGRDDDDDVASEPKSAGLDQPGAGKDDDDVASEPKSAGLDQPGR